MGVNTNVLAVTAATCMLGVSTSVIGACDLSSLNGTFGFSGSALFQQFLKSGAVRFDPYTEIGMVTYDGKGTASLSAIASFHGKQTPLKLSGTYAVKSGCTGTVTWTDKDGAVVSTFLIAIVLSGSQIETVDVRTGSMPEQSFAIAFSQKKQ